MDPNRSPSYAWSVSGGAPFNKFGPTASEGKVTPFSPPNDKSITCFFANEAPNIQVTCKITLSNPPDTITLTSKPFKVEAPIIYHSEPQGSQSMGIGMVGVRDQSSNPQTGNTVTPNDTSPNFFGLYGAKYPGRKPWGIFYNAWVEDKPGYDSIHSAHDTSGQFTFAQLVTEDSTITRPGGTPQRVFPQGIGMDTDYPYPNLPYKVAGPHPSADKWMVFADRPYVGATGNTLQLSYQEIDRKASFKLYLFYQAGDDEAGAGDVVPLRLIPWDFVSTATYDGTQSKWTVVNDPNNTIKASTDLPPFPEWHQVIN